MNSWLQADLKFHAGAFVHAGAPLNARVKRVCDENQYYLRFLLSRENVPWEKIDDEHDGNS